MDDKIQVLNTIKKKRQEEKLRVFVLYMLTSVQGISE